VNAAEALIWSQFGQMKAMPDGLLPPSYSTFELFIVAPTKSGFS